MQKLLLPFPMKNNNFSFFLIFQFSLASKDHWETLKVYKEMDRQDKEAAKTNSVPEYQRTGVVDMSGNKGNSSKSSNTYSGSSSKKN